ncbi:MAG: ABC transporter permease [Candidatus Sulfotelmatobacter sp.]
MSGLIQDLRYALRQLRKSPGFTAVAVLTLALGIGASTAMFSLVDRILFRSLPYPHDHELVSVGVIAPIIDGEFLFAANYLGWRDHQTPFADFTSSTGVSDCDLTDNHPVRIACASVASTFLPTFGIQPMLGRNFTREEDQPNAPPVALLAYGLWQDRFGGDRNVVGRTISLDGQPTRILGVLPRDFEFPTLARASLLVPEALDESMVQRNEMGPVVRVFGRMKPGTSIEQAKAELQPLFRDFVESAPPPFRAVLRLQVHSIRDLQIHDSRRAAWLLLASALSVLLIACANAANLVLARSAGRRHELAVRSALGAKRARLFQQRLTESVLFALMGGAAGAGLGFLIVHAFVSLAPAGIPHLSDATIDGRVLLFAIIVSLASGILVGTVPALEKPTTQMLAFTSTAGMQRARLRQLLLVAQVWVAVVLLASALLFVRSLLKLEAQPLGMNTENIVTAQLTLGQQKYSGAAERLAFYEELERKLKELPGLRGVALSDSLPPEATARTVPFVALQAEGRPPLAPEQGIGGVAGWRSITPDYFSVLGIPLLRGRGFADEDRTPASSTVILNEALAQRLFPGEDALGKIISFPQGEGQPDAAFTVIGVAANTENQGLGGRVGPEYYMVRRHSENDVIFRYPNSEHISVVVRSAVGPQAVARELRNSVATLDPTLPVDVDTLGQSVAKLAERPRFSAALLSLFAAVGLLLTAIGIYGVVSLLVSQRTQEIGIRMALGATPTSVVRMMLRQASIWVGVGVVAGILGSVAAARWIGSLLFDIRANDPATLAEAAALLAIVALFGAWIPARRAARVDPMVALRYE